MKKLWDNGPLLIIIAAILWAFDGIIRRSLYSLPPITIVFFEHLIGSIIILPCIYKHFSKEKLSRNEIGLIAFVALFSSVLGTLCFTTALLKVNFIPFSVVFLLQKLQPIFAIGSAAIFLKEKISIHYAKWAGLALVAAFFVTFPNGVVNVSTGSGTIVAALYALGAAFAWGAGTTFSKMALNKRPDTFVTGLRFLFATAFSLIGVFILGQTATLSQIAIPQWISFVFIAISTGMVALLIYYKGLKQTEVKVSTILELTFPFLAIVIDIFVYKTVLAPTQYIAAVVLLFAMFRIALLNNTRHPEER